MGLYFLQEGPVFPPKCAVSNKLTFIVLFLRRVGWESHKSQISLAGAGQTFSRTRDLGTLWNG